MKHKVLAYITRPRQAQVLVFTHRDYPEAGVQVPAGTVEPGEDIEHALFREVREESGLTQAQVRLVHKLGEYPIPESGALRHVFHLAASSDLPEEWTHIVHGKGEDNGMVFEYRWADLNVELAGNQHQWLGQI